MHFDLRCYDIHSNPISSFWCDTNDFNDFLTRIPKRFFTKIEKCCEHVNIALSIRIPIKEISYEFKLEDKFIFKYLLYQQKILKLDDDHKEFIKKIEIELPKNFNGIVAKIKNDNSRLLFDERIEKLINIINNLNFIKEYYLKNQKDNNQLALSAIRLYKTLPHCWQDKYTEQGLLKIFNDLI